MGNFKRIWSEGQATRIHKVTVQREQGLCKGGGEFGERICGRTGSKTGVPLTLAQVKRRREVWREKMIENEGSLVNRVMNGQVNSSQETQREACSMKA